MNTNYYKMYLGDVFKLAATLCIKSLESASLINDLLIAKYGTAIVNINNLNTWKYYLNISGEYHITDLAMTITSLDTMEIITLTKSVLALHPATKAAYTYGSRYYYNLVKLYPDQEQLILGILYPADINVAISATEGTILSYIPELIEPQEITLINDIEKWIKAMLIRWHVRGFNITDTLYPAAQHAMLYMLLVPKILNLRLKRCKTNEVHSFHIREYLTSHSRLDRFLPNLTLKQSLFLYRNIAYIEHNAGKADTFKWLTQNILTDRSIPLFEFSMHHKGLMDSRYRPDYVFRKKSLNAVNTTPTTTFNTLSEVFVKEAGDGLDTVAYINNTALKVDDKFRLSPSNIIKTKIVESDLVDLSNNVIHTLPDILLNHWAYMSANGLYVATIHFVNPKLGSLVTITAADAFIYMMYITARLYGSDITTIPSYISKRISITPVTTVTDLNNLSNDLVIKDSLISTWLYVNQPRITKCLSLNAFYTLIKKVYDVDKLQTTLISNQQHQAARAIVTNMVSGLYTNINTVFPDHGTPYTTWLASKGIPDVAYTVDESLKLIDAITIAATGYKVDPNMLLKNIQSSMIGVMRELSSYSVQFITTINKSPIRPLNTPVIRVGDVSGLSRSDDKINIANISNFNNVMNIKSLIKYDLWLPNAGYQNRDRLYLKNRHVYKPIAHTPQIKLVTSQHFMENRHISSGNMYLGITSGGITLPTGNTRLHVGYDNYDALTVIQQSAVLDIYHTRYTGSN